ncbi:SDR family NAD(P)-dependent oxidoreductase [Bacillus tropicus]|uniref:SDR family NAD(P)-dependent oxidoreductase n=1 Tax=Bacillus tropicus TaxID=2026188 RepID=UPI00307E7034
MIKKFLITNGDIHFNQLLSNHLLKKGHSVAMVFSNQETSECYQKSIQVNGEFYPLICNEFTEETVNFLFEEVKGKLDGLDILIHGNEEIDESQFFAEAPILFGEVISEHLRRIFLFNQCAVSYMMIKKRGQIIYPLIFDTLAYVGYPTSPILNHAKISMMKCLAKEISAFKLKINALTLGYSDNEFSRLEKKEKQKSLEIFGLKPKIQKMNELIKGIDVLVLDDTFISGQNIHITPGIETTI